MTIRLLETIAELAGSVQRPDDRAALLRQAEMIARGARDGLAEEEGRKEVEERFQSANQMLSEAPDPGL